MSALFVDGAAAMELRSPGEATGRHHLEPSDLVGVGAFRDLVSLPYDLLGTSLEVWRARIARQSLDLHDQLEAIDAVGAELGYPASAKTWSARFARLGQRDPMTASRFAAVLKSRELGATLIDREFFPKGEDVLVAMRCLRRRRGETGSRNRRSLADVLTAALERLDLSKVSVGRRMLSLLWLGVHPQFPLPDDDAVDAWLERWLALDPAYADRILRRLALVEAHAGGDPALALDLFVVEPEAWVLPVDVDHLADLVPQELGDRIVDWCLCDPDPKSALRLYGLYCSALRGNDRCAIELADAFSCGLSFGTGGIRAAVGVGPSAINATTVSAFSDALARFVGDPSLGDETPILIGFDGRIDSPDFAIIAAKAVAHVGRQPLLFERATHTPQWSFAVRYLRAGAGIMVTASHNRASDNGLKFADARGGQVPARFDPILLGQVADYRGDVYRDRAALDAAIDRRNKLHETQKPFEVDYVKVDLDTAYFEAIAGEFRLRAADHSQPVKEALRQLTVAYSPLFGLAGHSASAVAQSLGVRGWLEVIEQSVPDGRFPALESPNPEDPGAWRQVTALGESKQADLCMLHDPDGDRLGVAYRDDTGAFVRLGSDDIAVLIIDHVLGSWRSAKRPVVVASLVATPLIRQIVEHSGAVFAESGPGYRRVLETADAEVIEHPDRAFCFGYEAAFGYGFGGPVAEKDGIVAGGLMLCIAADFAARGMSLGEGVREVQARHGRWYSAQRNISLRDPLIEMAVDGFLSALSAHASALADTKPTDDSSTTRQTIAPQRIGGDALSEVVDRGYGVIQLGYGQNTRIMLRRSGTESKVKIYVHRLFETEGSESPSHGDRGRVETDRVADDFLTWIFSLAQHPR
jgi:phosphomannomutase